MERLILAPLPVVWRLLIDVRLWPVWGPSVRWAELATGDTMLGPGARGTVWTVGGVRMPFVVTDFVPERSWGWTVAGVNATGHQLMPADGGCRVRFEVPWWAVGYLPVCARGIDRLAELAQSSQ